jgi:hypothetical protein
MAKCIWICSRQPFPRTVEEKITNICNSISPDNITPREPQINIGSDIAYGIMNPTNTILTHGNSLMLGKLIGDNDRWHEPGTDFPEGIYALFRDGEGFCEIITDTVATRTIWYTSMKTSLSHQHHSELLYSIWADSNLMTEIYHGCYQQFIRPHTFVGQEDQESPSRYISNPG